MTTIATKLQKKSKKIIQISWKIQSIGYLEILKWEMDGVEEHITVPKELMLFKFNSKNMGICFITIFKVIITYNYL